MNTFKHLILNEAIKKKTIQVNTYGEKHIDIKELHIWLSSDDIISIGHNEDELDENISFGATYYSWMDDNIEIKINKTIIETRYDTENDKYSFEHISGLKGTLKVIEKYGRKRDVLVIPMNINTSDLNISMKALIES